MQPGDLKINGYYTNGSEVRHVLTIVRNEVIRYNHLSGPVPEVDRLYKRDNGIWHCRCTPADFAEWAHGRVAPDSVDAVEAASLSSVRIRKGIHLQVGETYWSGGDCLRKVLALNVSERTGLVEVFFAHEHEGMTGDQQCLPEAAFFSRPTTRVTFGAESLAAWLASDAPHDGRLRIFDKPLLAAFKYG